MDRHPTLINYARDSTHRIHRKFFIALRNFLIASGVY